MQPIPLIRATILATIADVADACGAPTERWLEESGISPGVLEHQIEFVPGRCVWEFVGRIGRKEGPRDLMFGVARRNDWRRARWAVGMAHCVTLGDALRRMASGWSREVPMNRMGLTVDGPVAWFWRRRTVDVHDWPGSDAAEQYCLSYMLEVIRAATGPRWQPDGLKLESPSSAWGAVSPALHGIRIHYREPRLAVGFPSRLLALPFSARPLTEDGPVGEPAAEDFQGSLRQVLRASVVGGLPGQDGLAAALGMSGRSLRRRLRAEGQSWRSVVNEVKFESANELLKRRKPVREVAQQLGYTDPANFTRFFEARTGVAPSRWLETVQHAQELAENDKALPDRSRIYSADIKGG